MLLKLILKMKLILSIFLIIFVSLPFNEGLPLKCRPNRDDILSNEIYESYEHFDGKTLANHPITKVFKLLGEKKVQAIYADMKNGRGPGNRLTCDTCELVLGLAKISIFSPFELHYLMNGLCQTFHMEDKRVCIGMADLFAAGIYYIYRNSNLTLKEMCVTLVGAECLPEPGTGFAKSDEWAIDLDHNSINGRLEHKIDVKTSYSDDSFSTNLKRTYRVLQLSDIHIDPFYDPGATASCGEPLCCRITSTDGKEKAGYWGDYNNCDSPKYTIEDLMAYINTTLSNDYQYIIWTGDMVAHDVWNTTKQTIINGSRSLTSMVNKYIANGKLVFPVIGNHEGFPVNQFPPPEITSNLSISWIYSELFNQWSQWIPEQYANTFKAYGYYANNVSPNFKVIVLNTNYCAKLNFWLAYNPNDPGNQLKWLANELAAAQRSGQSVHIVGHIPPDNYQCIPQWVHNYLLIVEKYNQTIKGQFFGHTHFDELRILFSPVDNSVPIGVAYIAPSVTTYESVNPGFRFYTIDSHGNVLDHQNYYMNLTDANKHYNVSTVRWIEEYSAKDSYSMSSLVPSEWNAIYQRMKTDDELFRAYYNHYHRYSDAFNKQFDDKLKKRILSTIPVFAPISYKKS